MRTTLDIDDDVLLAAKERVRRERTTAGQVISALARSALTDTPPPFTLTKTEAFHGFRPFTEGRNVVTNEHVNKLREDDGD
ncbi:MAG: CopG family transcriptional regulator [Burkholderiales bacterium]|nr:CopG family transcriptional regulator [Burkholderiales bacterium]